MELTSPVQNLKSQICIIFSDYGFDKKALWDENIEDFVRKLYRAGCNISVIGPKSNQKLGSKKNMIFFDRHEVVGLKILEASKSHNIELRILSKKTKFWSRLRVETCIVLGSHGIWPRTFQGWNLPGTLSLEALERWIYQLKLLPGLQFGFIGSSNRILQNACHLLERGAKDCYIIETSETFQCWRGLKDHFISLGGRFLVNHQIVRITEKSQHLRDVYLKNQHGTLILPLDVFVISPLEEEGLNSPHYWKKGLFYFHRKISPELNKLSLDQQSYWFEKLELSELGGRVLKFLDAIPHSDADGLLKSIKNQKKDLLSYQTDRSNSELSYSGKVLDSSSLRKISQSLSTPKKLERNKPIASLECFEKIACRACADACPESAIDIARITDEPKLLENLCTGCGACVAACPSSSAVMIKEPPGSQKISYFLPAPQQLQLKVGHKIELLNRQGQLLGSGRLLSSVTYEDLPHRVIEVEGSNVYLWDARKFKNPDLSEKQNKATEQFSLTHIKKGWIEFNGVKRIFPIELPISASLWLTGQKRFEDALFCTTGGCHMCKVTLNGKAVLACQVNLKDGDKLESKTAIHSKDCTICPCKNVKTEEINDLINSGVPETLAIEHKQLGQGSCQGRWCLQSVDLLSITIKQTELQNRRLRPGYFGYQHSLWKEFWSEEVVGPAAPAEPQDN